MKELSYSKLVEELSKIDFDKLSDHKNFFDIIKKPHDEVINSNVLEYFFNPNNNHGFDDLFLQALVQSAGDLIDSESIFNDNIIDVYTEQITDENKRIDVVIELENFVIGIENKIYSSCSNPFESYKSKLESINHDKEINPRNNCLIYLSLQTGNISSEYKPDVEVSYKSFLNNLKKLYGNYISDYFADSAILLNHFMKNLENLIEDKKSMTEEEIKVIYENRKKIKSAYKEISNIYINKIDEISRLVDSDSYLNSILKEEWRHPSKNYSEINYSIMECNGVKMDENFNVLLSFFLKDEGNNVKQHMCVAVTVLKYGKDYQIPLNIQNKFPFLKVDSEDRVKISQYWDYIDGCREEFRKEIYEKDFASHATELAKEVLKSLDTKIKEFQ